MFYVDIWGLYVDLRGLYVEHLRAIFRNGGRYVKINTKNEKLYPKTPKPSRSISVKLMQSNGVTSFGCLGMLHFKKYNFIFQSGC